jgi:hypothetical protein
MEVISALKLAKTKGEFIESKNKNGPGNAITRICEFYVQNNNG